MEKAKDLFNRLNTNDFQKEEIFDCVDPPYGYEGVAYAEIQDENGEWWEFHSGAYFTRVGHDDYEIDDIGGDVDFESPDGCTGRF